MDELKRELKNILSYFSESAVEALLLHAEIVAFSAGDMLCKQGAIEGTTYIILTGSVDVYQHESGQRLYVDTIRRGFVGELALLLDRPRTADVVAAEEVEALEITREDFELYVKQSPELVMELSKVIVQRVIKQVDNLLIELSRHRQNVGDAPKCFISYSRQDDTFVRTLASDLGRRGLNVWVDIFGILPGESWAKQVGRALDSCEMMILVLTPDAIASENVDDEWNYYLDNKKTVIPILLQECQVPFRLHKIQYISFVDNPYEDSLNRLMAHLTALDNH